MATRRAPERRAPPSATAEPLPDKLSPQLATLVDGPPADSSEWTFEIKFDGNRVLARIERGAARLFTRNGHDWTSKMPELARELAALPLQAAWVDGEVVILDHNGLPDFQALQNAFDGRTSKKMVFFAFDMPFCNGADLRGVPNEQRREALRLILQHVEGDRVRFSANLDARPQDLLVTACKLGFEGLIGKRKSGLYVSRRSDDWIKLKCTRRQEFVIGGFSDPQGSRKGLGALILGVHGSDGSLKYAGSVGSGFDDKTLADLFQRLSAIRTPTSPFANPKAIEKRVHWVRPELLAEVSFAEWTKDGKVRHAVFRGLRSDKPPSAIMKEEPVHMAGAAGATRRAAAGSGPRVKVSNPERVIDPSTGFTKLDLVRYYEAVAPLMMEHLAGRPVSLVRAPEGVAGEQFFQKHMDKAPIQGIRQLPMSLHPGHEPLIEVFDPGGFAAAAQMNVIEFHTWNARKDLIAKPDRMTFDLDPGDGVQWEHVQEAALLVRAILAELALPAFLKTSGGKGLHVVVPLKRLAGWDAVKRLSQAVVRHLAEVIPQRFVAKSGPKNRVGRIFVDYLRNGFGATTACAWTARARPGMGISVPVAWDELGKLTSGGHWTVQTFEQRLRIGNAPWEGYAGSAASINRAAKVLQG